MRENIQNNLLVGYTAACPIGAERIGECAETESERV